MMSYVPCSSVKVKENNKYFIIFTFKLILFCPFSQSYTLPAYFGGVSLTEENTIIEVKAIALSYFLDVSEDWRLVVGDKWERKFLEHVEKYAEIYYPDLEVSNNYF